MAVKHRNSQGQLKPLRERLSPEQLRARAAKTEVRRQISLEHAKTRGLAVQGFNNTVTLHKRLRRMELSGIATLVLLILIALGVILIQHGIKLW